MSYYKILLFSRAITRKEAKRVKPPKEVYLSYKKTHERKEFQSLR